MRVYRGLGYVGLEILPYKKESNENNMENEMETGVRYGGYVM